MTATEIAAKLAERAQDVASLLLPGGKRSGNVWTVGSLAGEAGNSLSVVLTGQRAGVWKDFAGDPDDKGDLIGLWQAVKGITLREACAHALEFLGIADDSPVLYRPAPKPARTFVRPSTAGLEPLQSAGPVFDYLTKTRGLSLPILDRYGVQQFGATGSDLAIVFPTRNPAGETVCLKYLSLAREPSGKKRMRISKTVNAGFSAGKVSTPRRGQS